MSESPTLGNIGKHTHWCGWCQKEVGRFQTAEECFASDRKHIFECAEAPFSRDPSIEQRRAFQPFVDVFKAAQAWATASDYSKSGLRDELQKACEKAREDLAQIALDAYLATLPKPAAKEGAS